MLPYTSFSFLAELFSFSSKFFKEEFFKSDFPSCSVSVRILSSNEERVLFLVVLLSCIIILYYYVALFCKGGLALFCNLLLFSTTRGILCFSARGFLYFSASSLYGFFELFKLSNINLTHESAFIFSADLQVSFFLHIRDCFAHSCRIFIIQFCEIRITSVAVSLLICQSGDLCIENLLKTGKVFCISDIRWQNSIKTRFLRHLMHYTK